MNGHPRHTQGALQHSTMRKMENSPLFALCCCCCCTRCEHPPWQQLFPFFALHHAGVTLCLCVNRASCWEETEQGLCPLSDRPNLRQIHSLLAEWPKMCPAEAVAVILRKKNKLDTALSRSMAARQPTPSCGKSAASAEAVGRIKLESHLAYYAGCQGKNIRDPFNPFIKSRHFQFYEFFLGNRCNNNMPSVIQPLRRDHTWHFSPVAKEKYRPPIHKT